MITVLNQYNEAILYFLITAEVTERNLALDSELAEASSAAVVLQATVNRLRGNILLFVDICFVICFNSLYLLTVSYLLYFVIFSPILNYVYLQFLFFTYFCNC
jgi:hypothetical protein